MVSTHHLQGLNLQLFSLESTPTLHNCPPCTAATALRGPVEMATLRWTLDFNGESSDPFEGFMLWTFTRTELITSEAEHST